MLYACGSNGSGQLGLGHEDDLSAFTRVPLDLDSPAQLSAGGNHTLILAQGTAFVTGKVGNHDSNTFQILKHPEGKPWTHCCSGWDHLFLSDGYAVYGLGTGARGELGLGDQSSADLELVKRFEKPIKALKGGVSHTVVQLQDDTLWGWGYNRQGALNITEKIVKEPTKLPGVASDVSCGRDFTLIIYNGTATGWGKRAAHINVEGAKKLFSGWSFFGIETDGGMQWHGNNAFGQLDPPQLERIAVGSEHGLGLKSTQEDDKVIFVETWGWGEHGNCPGPFKATRGAVVYGGCATSWVWSPSP